MNQQSIIDDIVDIINNNLNSNAIWIKETAKEIFDKYFSYAIDRLEGWMDFTLENTALSVNFDVIEGYEGFNKGYRFCIDQIKRTILYKLRLNQPIRISICKYQERVNPEVNRE